MYINRFWGRKIPEMSDLKRISQDFRNDLSLIDLAIPLTPKIWVSYLSYLSQTLVWRTYP